MFDNKVDITKTYGATNYSKPEAKPTKRVYKRQQETMVIYHKIADLENEKKVIDKKIQWLLNSLPKKDTVQKNPGLAFFSKQIYLYVLELEDGCWYVGNTRNVERRFNMHRSGKGAMWTKKHAPLRIHFTQETGITDDAKACKLEDTLTLEYAQKYGKDKVRGGGYCQTKPHWPKDLSAR